MTTIPTPAASTPKPTELRLALAIRGGVSLAVWMGGACSEIATLRASAGPDGSAAASVSGTYRRLLKLAGYDTVTVDVIAGTSAGGLNGVLLSQHLVCGARFGRELRDLWLTIGDLAELTRSASFTPAPSLLKGTDGFYVNVKAAMDRLAPEQPAVSETPLRLLVTATRLHPRDDALFPTTGYPVPAGRARAFFRFRHQGTDYPQFSDFTHERSRDQLAFAARTTSSFPAAFEPARTQVVDGRVAADAVDMRGVSSETGVPDADDPCCVQLMDGGVLNNIPIGWAVRTIAGMPADTPVDRWLVFLQPVSDDKPKPAKKDSKEPPSPARVVSLLRSMLSVKLGSESVLDGLQDLRALVAESVQLDAVLEATVGTQLTDQADEVVGRAVETYRDATGLAEVTRLRALLTDPLTILAGDPLHIPAETFPLRGSVGASSGDEVEALRPPRDVGELVLPDGTALSDVGRQARTPAVVARVVTMLLYVVRDREAEFGHVFSGVRGDLYGLRLAVETITAVRDRLVLRWASTQPGLTGGQLLRASDAELATLLRPALDANPASDGVGATWRARAAALASAYAASTCPDQPALATWSAAPYADVWAALVDAAVAVDDLLTQHGAAAHLLVGDGPGTAATAGTLAAIEVLTGAMRPDPLAGASNIRLAVCSASNVSPIEEQVLAVRPAPGLRTDLKLSGNQISNFAAFLSARWRLNDWTWGRLDGAQTLVNVVAGQDRLTDVTTEQLHKLFTAPPDLHGNAAVRLAATLRTRWETVYEERAAADPAAVARDVITERLQWEVLAEELPLLEQLETRPAGHDRPPSGPDLDAMMTAADASTQEDGFLGFGQLKRLGRVGDESVFALFPRSDLRRTLARLGFVAWSALLPGGRVGTAVQVLVAWTLAPFVLAVLLALVAPVSTMLASAAIWVAIAAATHEWASGASIPVALSFILAATMLALQHWFPWAQRRRRDGAGFPTGSTWVGPAAAALVAAAITSTACGVLWGWHETGLDNHGHARAVGLFAGLAVFLPLVYIATGTGAVGLAHLLRRNPKALAGALAWTAAVGVIATAVGFLAAFVAYNLSGGAAGFMVMYVSLLATLGGLFVLFGGLRPIFAGRSSR